METLAEFADALHRETHTLAPAASVEDLQELAEMYGHVIRDGVVAAARKLPAAERRDVLDPIRAQFVRVERAAQRRAESTSSPEPFRQIAAVAKKGNEQLRVLVEGAE